MYEHMRNALLYNFLLVQSRQIVPQPNVVFLTLNRAAIEQVLLVQLKRLFPSNCKASHSQYYLHIASVTEQISSETQQSNRINSPTDLFISKVPFLDQLVVYMNPMN